MVRSLLRRISHALDLRASKEPPYLRRRHRYHPPRALAAMLSTEQSRPVSQAIEPEPVEETDLHRLWREIPEGTKWAHYFSFYEDLFRRHRQAPVRLLEIGVLRGGSLELWSRYFPEGSTIVGVDINPKVARFDRPDRGIHVRVGSQGDADFLSGVAREFGPFDIVIDDASHIDFLTVASFNALFPDAVRPGGVYVVEDLHTNFWEGPFRTGPRSFVDYAKMMVDLINIHHAQKRGIAHFRPGDAVFAGSVTTPRLASEIQELRFQDSLAAVIRKRRPTIPAIVENFSIDPVAAYQEG